MITFPTPTVVGQASFVSGSTYAIKTVGTTNWTNIGASAATTGTIFVYNGVTVTGSGGDAWGTFSVGGKTWIWTGEKWQLVPLGTASTRNVPASGDAASEQVVLGSDTRLTGAMSVLATGSTTARTLANRFADVVNVKDFGAVGDGVAFDDAAIQAAIDANPSKTIYFPAGTYLVSSTIRVKGIYTSLVCDASGVANIRPTTNSLSPVILIQSDNVSFPNIFGVNIINLHIIKPSTLNSTTNVVGVEADRADALRMEGVAIVGFPICLKLNGGRNNFYSNLRLAAFGQSTSVTNSSTVILTSSTSASGSTGYTHMFDNCIIGGDFANQFVVSILGNDYCSFSNCYIVGSTVALVRINGQSSYVYDNWFDQCYFDGAKGYLDNPTPLGIWIQENSPSTNFNAIQNFTDCLFGQLDNAVYIDEESLIQVGFSDCRFTNIYESVISCSSSDVDLRINGCTFRRVCSELPNKQVISLIDVSSAAISSNVFQFESYTTPPVGTTIILLGGSMTAANVSITGNAFTSWSSNVTDYVNGGATISTLTITGNASNNATNTIVGSIIGNKTNSNPLSLDWYQEGTWTPVLNFGGATTGITYSNQVGSYTRIGNRVYFDMYLALTSKGSATGLVSISGLPFPQNAAFPANYAVSVSGMNGALGDANIDANINNANTSSITIQKQTASVRTTLTDADFTNTSNLNISGVYRV
jgi:hypothetical protein